MLKHARRDYIQDIAPPLSMFNLESTDVELLCETPAKNGATTGDGRPCVGPRAPCGPFPAQRCASTAPWYAY